MVAPRPEDRDEEEDEYEDEDFGHPTRKCRTHPKKLGAALMMKMQRARLSTRKRRPRRRPRRRPLPQIFLQHLLPLSRKKIGTRRRTTTNLSSTRSD
jgi:hypothetical protein